MSRFNDFLWSLATAALAIWIFWAMTGFSGRVQTQSPPYQAYKISYGCLYVVSNAAGGIAVAVTPRVGGECR